MSLVDGLIPAHTECPYKSKCAFAIKDACWHKGRFHDVAFSCGAARGWALVERNNALKSRE